MKVAIVSGSHRRGSQSLKVARYLERLLARGPVEHAALVLDLAETPLPLWDEGARETSATGDDDGDDRWQRAWGPMARALEAADAVVLVTPEWGGMATPAMKNFLLLCSGGELAHKPALIVAVSGSQGGAYPVAELRMTAGKNSHVCFIPEHVIVRRAASMLEGELPRDGEDASLRGRLDYAVSVLLAYAVALAGVRSAGVIDRQRFRYGM